MAGYNRNSENRVMKKQKRRNKGRGLHFLHPKVIEQQRQSLMSQAMPQSTTVAMDFLPNLHGQMPKQPRYTFTPNNNQDERNITKQVTRSQYLLVLSQLQTPVTGQYYLSGPCINPNYSSTVNLHVDTSSKRIWGQFNFRTLGGFLCLEDDIYLAQAHSGMYTFRAHWLAKDRETGIVLDGCGSITVGAFMHGKLMGRLDLEGNGGVVEFEGTNDAERMGSGEDCEDVEFYKQGWWALVGAMAPLY